MNTESISRRPLRLWPGVAIVVVQWIARFVMPAIVPGFTAIGVFAGVGGALAVVIWWLFFSRAPWVERLGALVLIAIGVLATPYVLDKSIATGMMGFMYPVVVAPVVSLALVAWAVATRDLADGPRRAWMAVAILVACGVFALLRTGGISGEASMDLHWRWTASPEERLLARAEETPAPPPVATPAPTEPPASLMPSTAPTPLPAGPRPVPSVAAERPSPPPAEAEPAAEWPGFRGPRRDGVARGARIATDWAQSPPVQMWRRPVGPGWSSFAVRGDRLYTQEQRGEEEIVGSYKVATGEPVWRHRDAARFWESNAGAGPRGTPTLASGRLYSLGATGILNALDAGTGAILWTRNAASDTEMKVPGWGFAGSPLVVGDLVIVATAGRLAAYDAASGSPRWLGPARGDGYSSPHLATFDGTEQVLLLSGAGATSVSPADGQVLWEYALPAGARIVQPALTPEGDVLVSVGEFGGTNDMRRLAVARGTAGWTTQEKWKSTGLKPNFNDFVVHEGHAYGFDGSILACLDLADGKRKWKGGRYGNGQLLLLPDQDALLVLSEEGELALVQAAPGQYTELARVPGIEGKTWNHPALVGDVLLVRNAEEMAAFRLPRAKEVAALAPTPGP